MSSHSTRPSDLPDFLEPPLNEVAIGVQFDVPKSYQQIFAGEVWSQFRSRYPKVQEHPALPPSFETFGLPSRPTAQVRLVNGPMHDRFWFLTDDEEELIQFQPDRFLHNWRKVGNESNTYPRFESMVERFQQELEDLNKYLNTLEPQTLRVNQCEITYVNHIVAPPGEQLRPDDWLQVLNFAGMPIPEGMSLSFNEVIKDESDQPFARLTVESTTGFKSPQTPVVLLNITVRGAPRDPSVGSSIEFLKTGRSAIVKAFASITTDRAQKHWKRTQ
jgi:uncharacterized protein (TIGR04255 family)